MVIDTRQCHNGHMNKSSSILEVPPAAPEKASQHYADLLEFETDCWDVHHAFSSKSVDFVLLDVRSPELFRKGHLPGSINLPHGKLVERNLEQYPHETVFVVYCAGPHCNGADKAALRLARLGRPVKKMIGGIEGWQDEGFNLTSEQ